MERKNKLLGGSLLLLTALIWGVAFVAQTVGMDHIGAYTFNTSRLILGSVVLIPWAVIDIKRERKKPGAGEEYSLKIKRSLKASVICGVALFMAMSLQQFALVYSQVANVSFLTTLYILIIPIISLIMGKKQGVKLWIAIVIAVAGMYLLCIKEGFSFAFGDSLAILCALMFGVQILCVDHFVGSSYTVLLSCMQNLVAAMISFVFMLVFEDINLDGLYKAMIPLLYTGILSTGVAYTTQMIGQRYVKPSVAALIMSLESVIASVAAWLILSQSLSVKEIIGCVLVFAAVILAQIE